MEQCQGISDSTRRYVSGPSGWSPSTETNIRPIRHNTAVRSRHLLRPEEADYGVPARSETRSSSPKFRRVFEENRPVYGLDKVGTQLNRKGIGIAGCTAGQLMKGLGLEGGDSRLPMDAHPSQTMP